MPKFVEPKVYLVGATGMIGPGVTQYLKDTGQTGFEQDIAEATQKGIPSGLILCSLYAKLCYKSLVIGKNANLTKTRSVDANLRGTFEQGHGSVFEHCSLNFIVTDCSRVYTHEQVRHRVGAAYSQTSGRYCRLDTIDFVADPILNESRLEVEAALEAVEDAIYLVECKVGLRKPPNLGLPHPDRSVSPTEYKNHVGAEARDKYRWVPISDGEMNFDRKKKLTSAIRRIAPNGQANEMGMTLNVRTLRHVIELRTAPAAEWEIRHIYGQVYRIVKEQFPLLVADAQETMVDGLLAVGGMHHQPYQRHG